MREWERLLTRLWRDREFLALDADPRILFVWSFTDPATNLSGLYHAPPKLLAAAIAPVGRAVPAALYDRLEQALHALAPKPFLLYDDAAEVVWVPQRCKHANRSVRAAVQMRREYRACPDSPLKAKFRKRYGRKLEL